MILVTTPLSPALAAIILLLEAALIGGKVLKIQMRRTIIFSWNVKVERVLELPSNVGV